jgi:ribonuclease HI
MNRIGEACAGELALLDPVVRASRAAIEQLLHPNFAERGRSGRLWNREEIISALIEETDGDGVDVQDLQGEEVVDGVVLVTYIGVRSGSATGRSSLWIEHDGRMRVRWHQGTPLTAPMATPAGRVMAPEPPS